MKNGVSLLSWFVLSIIFINLPAKAQESEENPFRRLEICACLLRPPQSPKSSQIKDIQVFGEKSGIVFTSDSLFRTFDNGENWYEVNLPKNSSETISVISFLNENVGWAILANQSRATLQLAKTHDGGNSWVKMPMSLRQEDLAEANLEEIKLVVSNSENARIELNLTSSSNFIRRAFYTTNDDGQSWTPEKSDAEKKSSDKNFRYLKWLNNIQLPENENALKIDKTWILTSSGNCESFKTGCVQETRVRRLDKDITPPQIKELSRIEKENAKLEARNSVFATPPNGSTRISLNRGFDKCTAAPASQMHTWWNNSPFYDSNIYISGRNRGCSQAQLTAAWVTQVSAMGWGFIPTIVGYQSPCSVCTSCQKHSSDTATAETQGRGEADIAITDANNLGLTQGTVLYYDMERYDETVNTPNCRVSTNAFLKGWTDRLKEQGYISGVYGSPFNANADWINIPQASQMDAVWLARWNNIMSVWGVAPLADNVWTNHQRIHQWLGPRDETWGGVTFNIDNNISDGPVAGALIAKNKTADFDGDGKTDISVWRPGTGVWYITNSSNASYTIQGFGLSTDVLAPGDFDGDGKTDLAVFRPSDGVWHVYSRSIYRSFQWGTVGDIPVPADYNGDGSTDIAIFRPSNGVWYVWNSSGGANPFRIEQFGLNGDKPVTGDYDGDGKADLAVWRPSNGVWYVLRSSDGGVTSTAFGLSNDKPAQGDFDADGKTDFAVYRDGIWYVQQTTNGFFAMQFGITGDLPVTGDFDGDNKADIAVFRPSNGVWYLQQSLNGFSAMQFGISTDKPIPNAYLPQ